MVFSHFPSEYILGPNLQLLIVPRSLDTLGFVARDMSLVQKIVTALVGGTEKKIVIHDDSLRVVSLQDFQYKDNPVAEGVFEEFFVSLEQHLGFKRILMSLAAAWEANNPAGKSSMSDFMDIVRDHPSTARFMLREVS